MEALLSAWEAKSRTLQDLVSACCAGDVARAQALFVADQLEDGGCPTTWKVQAMQAAASNGHISILEWLLREVSVHLLTARSWFPHNGLPQAWLHIAKPAAERGQIAVLQWLWDQDALAPRGAIGGLMTAACHVGNVAVMQWLLTVSPKSVQGTCAACTNPGVKDFIMAGMRSRDMGVLNWIMEHLVEAPTEKVPDGFLMAMFETACSVGMSMVAWVESTWPAATADIREVVASSMFSKDPQFAFRILLEAAVDAGHLDVVKWLHTKLGVEDGKYTAFRLYMCLANHCFDSVPEDVFRYLVQDMWQPSFVGPESPRQWIPQLVLCLVKSNRVSLLRWLHEWVDTKCVVKEDGFDFATAVTSLLPRYLRHATEYASVDALEWLLHTFADGAAASQVAPGFKFSYCSKDQCLRYMRWMLDRAPDTVSRQCWKDALRGAVLRWRCPEFADWVMQTGKLGPEDVLACCIHLHARWYKLPILRWAWRTAGVAFEAQAFYCKQVLLHDVALAGDGAGVRALWDVCAAGGSLPARWLMFLEEHMRSNLASEEAQACLYWLGMVVQRKRCFGV
jgi:hypothetical protein